jgi:hypothetical protein
MNTTATNVAARLEAVIGAARVNGTSEFCAKFAVDGIVPSSVARPTSPAEVVEIVRFANSEKLALIPCGHRTKLGIGMPPARYDIALDMIGLNQIAYYDPSDLTLSVDAGMNLAQLADVLAQQKQFVPLAVPFFDECTVGGTIASNIGSSLRPGYGSARDFLLGAEFVNGAGTFTKSGGRVVKNVTGYDLQKFNDHRDSALPSWFTRGAWHVCVGFEGTETVLRRYSSELVRYAQQCRASNYHLLEKSDKKSIRSRLQELVSVLSRSLPAATIFRINAFPEFPPDVSTLGALAARFSIPSCIFANSSGSLYFALAPNGLGAKTIGALAQIGGAEAASERLGLP